MPVALRRLVVVVTAALSAVLLGAAPAGAHPLGNFTVNTYSAVVVEPAAVRVDVVVDRAEIPTRQVFPDLDDRSGTLPGGTDGPAREQCADVAAEARLTVDGRPADVTVTGSTLTFPPGVAGLRTARLTCALTTTAAYDDLAGTRIGYALDAFSEQAGWREVTAVGDGVGLSGSDVPERSISDALRAYPEDRLDAPLDVRSAGFDVTAGSGLVSGLGSLLDAGPVSAIARGADGWTSAFTELVARDTLTAPFVLLAMGAAVLLGGLHAFAPGHGKTVMAAYLVGERRSLRDAAVIGASVTATHTLGVLALGVVLTAVGLASPERVYPWLGLASGLLLVGIGVALLHSARHRTRPALDVATVGALVPAHAGAAGPHAAPHTHGHTHDDDDHSHDHGHTDHDHHHTHDHAGEQPHSHGLFSHTHAPARPGSGVRGLLAVGFAGGMVPSPSALVVLLGGIALGRTWFGVVLVLLYGVGMALALTGTGVLLMTARDRIDTALRRGQAPRGLGLATRAGRVLPVLTAGLVVVVGVGLALRALTQL